MDVTSVKSSSTVSAVTTAATQVGQVTSGTLPDATQTSVSPEASLFGQLSSLAQSDPARFKQVAQEISDKLKDAAGQATGGKADFLNQLAARFGDAAQSGDASVLKPDGSGGAQGAGGAHRHHGHHAHHAAMQSGATQSAPSDTVAQIIQTALTDTDGTTAASAT